MQKSVLETGKWPNCEEVLEIRSILCAKYDCQFKLYYASSLLLTEELHIGACCRLYALHLLNTAAFPLILLHDNCANNSQLADE